MELLKGDEVAKSKKPTKKPTKGRPTKYNPKYAKTAGALCREKGFTDKNLAVHFKVSESTINKWKLEFSEFSESIKKGKDEFDSREVEQCLLKRCKGYSYVETTRELQTDSGELFDEESEVAIQTLVVTKKVNKHMAPDVTAQIFWLKNRQPQRWSDKKEIAHRVAETEEPLTEEELDRRLKALRKAGTGIDKQSIEGG